MGLSWGNAEPDVMADADVAVINDKTAAGTRYLNIIVFPFAFPIGVIPRQQRRSEG